MLEKATETILHPIRMRILMTLVGRQLTTRQIGMTLPDVAQATLYRHLSRLVRADLIAVVAQRPVRGVMEKVYGLAREGSPISPDASGMNQDDWRRAFAAFTGSLLGQFEAYLSQGSPDLIAGGVGFRTTPLYLSDTEFARFVTDLRALTAPALAQGPSPDRRRRLLSTIFIPDADFDQLDQTD